MSGSNGHAWGAAARGLGLILGLAASIAAPTLAQTAGDPPITVVYFGFEEPALTDRGRQSLDEFTRAFRATKQSELTVSGHIDRAEADEDLARRRAEIVRDYLVAAGVPAPAITVQSFGELRPLVETPDGAREPDNRRVEVIAGPGAGW